MKKIIAFSFVVAAAGLLNVGCTASAGVHTTDATKVSSTQQVAYVTARPSNGPAPAMKKINLFPLPARRWTCTARTTKGFDSEVAYVDRPAQASKILLRRRSADRGSPSKSGQFPARAAFFL